MGGDTDVEYQSEMLFPVRKDTGYGQIFVKDTCKRA